MKKRTVLVKKVKRDIRIVVLDRGWVVVGLWSKTGTECRVDNAYVIRVWGTTAGLGQLAITGPTAETILDQVTLVRYHELSEVFNLECFHQSWEELC